MIKHSELRSTCFGSVTEVPDVRDFWEPPETCDHAVFFIAENPGDGGRSPELLRWWAALPVTRNNCYTVRRTGDCLFAYTLRNCL